MAIAILTKRKIEQTESSARSPISNEEPRLWNIPTVPVKFGQPTEFSLIPFLDPVLSLSDWVRSLHKCVEKERNIIIAPSVANEHIARLTALNYPNDRRTGAEYWSIAGNWQFKSPKAMTMQDYFPSNEQLKQFVDYFVSKSRMQEIILKERRKFEQTPTTIIKNTPGDAEKAIAEITSMYSYEQKRRCESEKLVEHLRKEIFMLENQVERAKTVFSERFSMIASHVLNDKLTLAQKLILIGELSGAIKPIPPPKNTDKFHDLSELNDLPGVILLKPQEIVKKS